MIFEALSRLGESQPAYLAISQAILFGFAGLAVAAAFSRRLHARLATPLGAATFLAVAALAVLAARWPTFFVRDALNEDEAQALAQAITALHDPIPWLSFDGNTCGPLNTYVLMLPALFGSHLSFLSTRVISVVLEFGSVAALYGCVALLYDAALARIAIVPPIAFFALITQPEFVHYSSERLSIFLAMLALLLFCLAARKGYAPGRLLAAGIVAGMIPFAKLQAVPLDIATLTAGALAILASASLDPRQKAVRAAALAAGVGIFPAVLLAIVAAHGVFHDFWISYIASSLAYILWTYEPLSFVTRMPEFGLQFDLLFAVALSGAAVLALRWKTVAPARRNVYLASLLILAGAIDAIYAPKRGTLHYVLFGLLPVASAAAAALGLLVSTLCAKDVAGLRRGWIALGFVGASLLAQGAFTRGDYPYLNAIADYLHGPPDAVEALIAQNLSEGDRLAIWGWRPKYVAFSYTRLGTRDAIGWYQFSPNMNPYLDYYRARYIGDLERNRPRGFLDVGPESFDRDDKGRYGHEVFPALAAIVRRDYRLVGTVHFARFYVRRDAAEPSSSALRQAQGDGVSVPHPPSS
jgi:hypothetical protein